MFSSLSPDFHQCNKIQVIGMDPGQVSTLKTRLYVFYNKLSWVLSGKVLLYITLWHKLVFSYFLERLLPPSTSISLPVPQRSGSYELYTMCPISAITASFVQNFTTRLISCQIFLTSLVNFTSSSIPSVIFEIFRWKFFMLIVRQWIFRIFRT
jgi:hypothetical protein